LENRCGATLAGLHAAVFYWPSFNSGDGQTIYYASGSGKPHFDSGKSEGNTPAVRPNQNAAFFVLVSNELSKKKNPLIHTGQIRGLHSCPKNR
jgi:hypothetical protein